MATRVITGLVHHASGAVWVGATVTFEMEAGTFTISPDVTFLRDGVTAVTDSAGAFTVTLTSGLDVYWRCSLPDGNGFRFALADGSATTLEALRSASEGLPTPVTDSANILITDADEDDILMHDGTQFVNVNATALMTTDVVDDLDSLYVAKAAFNAKGDLLVGGANDTYNNLPVGNDDEFLVVDSAEISGLRWSDGAFVSTTRAIPTTVGNYINIGTFTTSIGTHNLRIAITVSEPSFSIAKLYDVASDYSTVGGAWRVMRPTRDSGYRIAASDFELLFDHIAEDLILRLRRTVGTTAGTATIRIWNLGKSDEAFVASSTTGTDAAAYMTHAWKGNAGDMHQRRANATFAGTDVATAQPVFAASQQSLGTMPAGTTWDFEAMYVFSRAAGTTAHTVSTLFANSGSFTDFTYLVESSSTVGNVLGAVSSIYATAATATVVTASDNTATEWVRLKLRGSFTINATGNITPQIQYSAAPGGVPTFQVGTFFRCWQLGRSGFTASGQWF